MRLTGGADRLVDLERAAAMVRDEEDEGWTVVDFKTDHELARGLERYRRQVALYAPNIGRATGRPARGVILRV